MKTTFLFTFTFIAFWLQSCNMVNPNESIPTFIQLDSVNLVSTAPNIHGSVAHKITDVWVYYNRQLLGAYQLPAKVPVLASGRGELQVLAGVWENGLSGIRSKYPFYTLDTFAFTASPGNIIKHIPVFNYRTADSVLPSYFIEDFEQGNSFQTYDGDTTFLKTDSSAFVFEGTFSNRLQLKDTLTHGSCITIQEFSLPSDKICYIEINYKSDIPFVFRTLVSKNGSSNTYDVTGINSNSKWSKIYINFGDYVANYPGATFKFIFDAVLPSGTSHANIMIDNFKIIHFK